MSDRDERTRRQVLAATAGVATVGVLGSVVADEDDLVNTSQASQQAVGSQRTSSKQGPAVEWSRRYYSQAADPTPEEDAQVWVRSVTNTADGGFSLAGHQSYGSGTDDFVLLKTDAEGRREWLREYDGDGDRDVAYSHVVTDDGYLLVGQYFRDRKETPTGTPSGPYVRRPWVVRADAEGAEVWRVEPGDDERAKLNDCVQTSDGGFVAVGWVEDSSDQASWFLKLDASGEPVVDERFHSEDDGQTRTENAGGEPSYEDRFTSVVETSDGDLLVGGGGNQGGQVARVDTSGTIQWETDLGYQRSTVGDVVETDDENVAVTGRYHETEDGHIETAGPDNSDLYVALLTAAGSVEWTKTVNDGETEAGRALVQTDDGGFAAAGASYDEPRRGDLFAAKITADRTERWSASYADDGGRNADEGVDLVQTADGGYAIAVRTYFVKLEGGFTPTPTETADETPTDTLTRTETDTESTASSTPTETADETTATSTDAGSSGDDDCTI